jgi:membrane protein DedA with SNARE-associated domain
MEALLVWLTRYGYAGLFVLLMFGILGLPIPDETLLIFCGYLIFRGRLHFGMAFLAGFGGSLCGISLSYWLGRKFGRKLIHQYGKYFRVTPQHIHDVDRWFHRIGGWSLTSGYFFPAIRHFTALVAGMVRMPYRTFAAFAYPGAAIWVATFLTLGYVLGERWEHTSAMMHRYSLVATGIAAATAAAVWWLRRQRSV